MMSALATTAMTLGELLGPGAGIHGAIQVSDLTLDSRRVTEGAAFVAVAGAREHGLDYAREALARGAAVIVYEPDPGRVSVPEPSVPVAGLRDRLGELARTFFGRSQAPPSVAGVTGTNGKSTVAHLIAQAMTVRGMPCGYIGTLGYGVPPALTEHGLTTPDCLSLHREIRDLAAGHIAVEVSSHALAQDRIAGLAIGTAVFTNLSHDHLDHHGDLTAYGRAKAKLFQRPGLAHGVLNVDDPFSSTLLAALSPDVSRLQVSTRGAAGAELSGRVIESRLRGIRVEVAGRLGAGLITSPLVGSFNAENLLLALGALTAWDVSVADGCAALSRCAPLPGRMEVLGGEPAPWVVVDYAHTPAALERVLESLRALVDGEIWCVFGCGGERDRAKRAPMGAVAARGADHIVLTDDNPRGEAPGEIVAQIRSATGEHPHVIVEHDRATAITGAIHAAAPDDLVLIAGKGHETWQIVGRRRRAFSDRATVETALEGRG